MEGPVEIVFKNVTKTPQLEELLNRRIAKLEKMCSYMISCRIAIEKPQQYQDTGNPYQVRIDIKVPHAHEIVAKQLAGQGDMHFPIQSVIGSVFDAAERQLNGLTDRQHREIKAHPQQQVMGVVNQLFTEEDYGFIKALDSGEDLYFHRNSLVNANFNNLKVGTGVRFVSEQGEKGLQASSVEIILKPAASVPTKEQ